MKGWFASFKGSESDASNTANLVALIFVSVTLVLILFLVTVGLFSQNMALPMLYPWSDPIPLLVLQYTRHDVIS